MNKRSRSRPTVPFPERLASKQRGHAGRLKARRAETASHMTEWLTRATSTKIS